MGFFSKARDMYSLQKQAKSVKKELKSIHIEAESDGVTAVVSAEPELVSIAVSEPVWNELKGASYGKKKLEEALMKAVSKAYKKAQDIAGTKMKGVWEKMNNQ